MKKILTLILFLMLLWILPQGCSNDNDPTYPEKNIVEDEDLTDPDEEEGDEQAKLTLLIVDAPGDYTAVYVDVVGLEAVINNDTIALDPIWAGADQPDPGILNLLEYTGGGFDYLTGEHPVPEGELTAIILHLGDDNTVYASNGRSYSLTLTEESLDGIFVPYNHTFEIGVTSELILDFDVDASIQKPEDANDDYILDPTLRISNNATTGHIYGTLDRDLGETPAILTVTANGVTYSTQTYDYEFMLWGLPPGTHDLTFTFRKDSGIEDLKVNDIIVVAGERTDIGPLDH